MQDCNQWVFVCMSVWMDNADPFLLPSFNIGYNNSLPDNHKQLVHVKEQQYIDLKYMWLWIVYALPQNRNFFLYLLYDCQFTLQVCLSFHQTKGLFFLNVLWHIVVYKFGNIAGLEFLDNLCMGLSQRHRNY